MIRSIIDHINTQIDTLGIFTKLNGLTSVERKAAAQYPAIYSGGEKQPINFDFNTASLYHRMTNAVSISQNDDETTGCEIELTETYRMRVVLYFPKKVLNNDDAYIELKVANNVKKLLAITNINSIQNTFGFYGIEVQVTSIDTDAFTVWNAEFNGVDYRVPSNYCLVGIDYNIILKGNTTCFYEYVCE